LIVQALADFSKSLFTFSSLLNAFYPSTADADKSFLCRLAGFLTLRFFDLLVSFGVNSHSSAFIAWHVFARWG